MGRTGTATAKRGDTESQPGLRVVEPPGDERTDRPERRPLVRALADLLREPLVHFLLIGVLLLAASAAWRNAHDLHTVVVTPERVANLAAKHALQFGEPPTAEELERLVDLYVEEEVLYREGRALGLDQDDEIVRRRIAQKTEFLLQDREAPPEPTQAQLEAFYAAAPERYVQPPRTSFSHLYFSPDAGGEAAARDRAVRALDQLNAGAAPEGVAADPFPDRNDYAAMSAEQAARVFGDSELAQAVGRAPAGAWSGPYRSGYGWHLVRVSDHAPGGRLPYAAVAERVRDDFMADQQAKANARAAAELRRRYTVVRRDREAAP